MFFRLIKIKTKISRLNPQRFGSFGEHLVKIYYQSDKNKTSCVHYGLVDLEVENRKIDLKSRRFLDKKFKTNKKLRPYYGPRIKGIEYEQLNFYKDQIVLHNDSKLLRSWTWESVEKEYNIWFNNRGWKINANIKPNYKSFGDNLKKELLNWYISEANNKRIKVIQRGPHKWSPKAQPFNSYPTKKEIKQKDFTIYIKWNFKDGKEVVSYIIAFPHKPNLFEYIPVIEPPKYVKAKGKKYLIDFIKIYQNYNNSILNKFFFKDEKELKEELFKRFPL